MLNDFLTGRTRLLAHLTGWAVVYLTFFFLISWARGAGEAFVRATVNLAFMLTMFYGHARLLVNPYLETGRYGRFAIGTLGLWLGMVLLRSAVERQLPGLGVFKSQVQAAGPVKMFVAFGASFFLLLLFSTLYQLLENRRTLELRHQELETRHVEAQLNYLKAQINPHFLFNTLNNIYAAAVLGHAHTAEMVLRLSDLLRYVTYDSAAARVPLEKEIAQIRAYIELFRLKSPTPLNLHFELHGDPSALTIEPVLLLPLVENALKHGDIERRSEGFVNIELEVDPARLVFRVRNSFEPDDLQKDPAGGVGLSNVRQRLELNYPKNHRLDIVIAESVFTVLLEITY